MSDDPAFVPIAELGDRLRSGATTSEALTRACLDRLLRLGPRFNCVVTLMRTSALAEPHIVEAGVKYFLNYPPASRKPKAG